MKIKMDSIAKIIDLMSALNTEVSRLPTESETNQIFAMFHGQIIALHHVAKIENKRHKIPFPLKLRKVYEAEGKFLHTIFELCGAVHLRQEFIKYSCDYKNGYYWFLAVNKEVVREKINIIYNPLDFSLLDYEYNNYLKNGEEKRRLLSLYRKQLQAIQKYENPYNDLSCKIYADLIEQSIRLAEQPSHFNQKYLLPHIKAGRELIKTLDSSKCHIVSVKNGEIKRQKIGRAKTVL